MILMLSLTSWGKSQTSIFDEVDDINVPICSIPSPRNPIN